MRTAASRFNFKTPSGLKIRLNPRYFFCQLTKPSLCYTEEDMVNNDTMYTATAIIESTYLIPTMLIQVFTLFAILFNASVPVFCISATALCIFGCIWRCSKQVFLLNIILSFFSTAYNKLRWLFFIVLIALVFSLDSTYLVFPYIITRIVCSVIMLLQNYLISNVTYKKYGVPFNDTEIIAFRVFHTLSRSTLKMSDYIKLYVSVIYNEETPTYW